MNNKEWNALDWCQHKAIHLAYDILLWLHDKLINYACERNLWRTPKERTEEQPPQ